MGLVSDGLVAGAALVTALSLGSRDRAVTALALFVTADLLVSLLVHWTLRGLGRSAPLMLMDCVGLYIMCLTAVCRLDRPRWLYGLCLATALQCLSHLLYVAGWISANGHILLLNLLFLAQLGCLVAGRWSAPEDEASITVPDAPRFAPAGGAP